MGLVSIWSIKEGQRLRFCIGWIVLSSLSWLIYAITFQHYDYSTWAKGVCTSKQLIRGLAEIAGSWIVITYSVTIGWDTMGALRDYVLKRNEERGQEKERKAIRKKAEEEGNKEVLNFLDRQEQESEEVPSTR